MADPQPNLKEMSEKSTAPPNEDIELHPLDAIPKGRWERSWPTIACGAGLFSDGYLNAVCITLSLFVHAGPQNTQPNNTMQRGECSL